jgi:chromosome partitioning protein
LKKLSFNQESFNPELCRNESEVESKLIVQYLLPKLGYTPETWHQEVGLGNIRLDFLAFTMQMGPFVSGKNSPPGVVMEAKHPKQNLNNHVPRLRYYLTSLDVRYGLLTNGKEIRIYENNQDDILIIFQCLGEDIAIYIDEIRGLIGRDALHQPKSKPLDLSQSQIIDTNPSISTISNISTIPNVSAISIIETPIIENPIIETPIIETPIIETPIIETTAIETPIIRTPTIKTSRQDIMKSIAIYHNKGGVGKTTVAINLAAALRKKGKRVLLIDIDSQANSTFAAGLVKFQFDEDDDLVENNVYHILESGDFNFIPDLAKESQYFNNPEIDVIPSHITLIEYQEKLNKIGASRTRLISKLKKVEGNYDIVIIDTPPSRDLYAEVALIAADYLIIPSDLKPFANQGLPTVKNFIGEVNEYREAISKAPLEILGVLPSKISTNYKFLESTFPKQRQVIIDKYKLPLMDAVIYERTALSQCLNKTLMIGEFEYPDPKSVIKFAEEIEKTAQQSAMEFDILAKEVLKKIG